MKTQFTLQEEVAIYKALKEAAEPMFGKNASVVSYGNVFAISYNGYLMYAIDTTNKTAEELITNAKGYLTELRNIRALANGTAPHFLYQDFKAKYFFLKSNPPMQEIINFANKHDDILRDLQKQQPKDLKPETNLDQKYYDLIVGVSLSDQISIHDKDFIFSRIEHNLNVLVEYMNAEFQTQLQRIAIQAQIDSGLSVEKDPEAVAYFKSRLRVCGQRSKDLEENVKIAVQNLNTYCRYAKVPPLCPENGDIKEIANFALEFMTAARSSTILKDMDRIAEIEKPFEKFTLREVENQDLLRY